MSEPLRVVIVGDRDAANPSHVATEEGVRHAADVLAVPVGIAWVATDECAPGVGSRVRAADAVFVAPGSPYRSMDGALAAIRFARQSGLPLLGTCAGFQHVVLEYARNVLGRRDAGHAEYGDDPDACVVAALTCSLVGQTRAVHLVAGTRAARIHRRARVDEAYLCSYGLAPGARGALEGAGLVFSGEDADGQPRVLELPSHPFFLATLYVPQLRSTPADPHPLLSAFVAAAVARG